MKVTTREAMAAEAAFAALSQYSLPVALALRVRRSRLALAPVTTSVREVAEQLEREYAAREKDGGIRRVPATGVVRIPPEQQEGYHAAVRELMAAEVEVEVAPLRAADLPRVTPHGQEFWIEPAILDGLGPFFVEG